MNRSKTILSSVILLAALLQAGCSATASASTSSNQPPPVINSQECYDHANGVVSPAWASLNKVQRSVLAMQIINACEGK